MHQICTADWGIFETGRAVKPSLRATDATLNLHTAPYQQHQGRQTLGMPQPNRRRGTHAPPFCLFPPTRGLALTLATVPLTSGPPPSSPSTLTALPLLRLFVTLGLVFALVPWLALPALVFVPWWLGWAIMPTLVGACGGPGTWL